MGRVCPSEAWNKFKVSPDATRDLCSMIINGESQSQIARNLGCGISTLSEWVSADTERSARVNQARKQAASTYADLALEELRAIPDDAGNGAIARQREIASHLRWRAKVADPATYGDKLDVKSETTLRTLPDEVIGSETSRLLERLAGAGVLALPPGTTIAAGLVARLPGAEPEQPVGAEVLTHKLPKDDDD